MATATYALRAAALDGHELPLETGTLWTEVSEYEIDDQTLEGYRSWGVRLTLRGTDGVDVGARYLTATTEEDVDAEGQALVRDVDYADDSTVVQLIGTGPIHGVAYPEV